MHGYYLLQTWEKHLQSSEDLNIYASYPPFNACIILHAKSVCCALMDVHSLLSYAVRTKFESRIIKFMDRHICCKSSMTAVVHIRALRQCPGLMQ